MTATPTGSAVMRLSPTDTQLLRACLLTDRACVAAWVAFAAAVKDPRAYFSASSSETKSVIPQLFASVQRAGAPIEPKLATYLKTAYVREEARYQTYSRICARLLSALNVAELPYVLLSGSALAEAFYHPAFLRHCYDIEVMVPPGHFQPAEAAAAGGGFTDGLGALNELRGARRQHRSGVGLRLSTRYTSLVGPDRLLAQTWHSSERSKIYGFPTRTLGTADALFALCDRLMWPGGEPSLLSACDAWRLIAHTPHMDWDRVLICVHAFAVSAEVHEIFNYLATALDAPIPQRVVEQLAGTGSARMVACDGREASGVTLGTADEPHRFESIAIAQGRYLAPGTGSISFAIGGSGTELTFHGWSCPEKSGRWTIGRAAQLAFRVPKARGRHLHLAFDLGPFLAATHRALQVDIVVNGSPIDRWSYSVDAPIERQRCIVLDGDLLQEDLIRIDFRIINPGTPASVGLSADTRELGLHFKALDIRWRELPVREMWRYRHQFPGMMRSVIGWWRRPDRR
jgi:Uncharacterised nucleotidyltransferase